MDKVDQARKLFAQLEARNRNVIDVARRSFEIESRLALSRR